MHTHFSLFKRKTGIFYMKNKITGQHKTLRTRDRTEAQKLVQAHNDIANQPIFNLTLARVYLAGVDPKLLTRTWQEVMNHIVQRRGGETRRRWAVAIQDENFDCIRHRIVVETRPEHFDMALADGKPSTNVYLRRIHNHALGMEWLLKSVLPRLLWPKPVFKKKRAITRTEHAAIISREGNAERRDFYELLWYTGASQSDAAFLLADDINWPGRTIAYSRKKLAGRDGTGIKPALIRFGDEVDTLLKRRPGSGPLFPYLRTVRPSDRATEFKQRCDGLKIEGVTLHSYRYAWAERALKCGYPERFAQQALGHNSKAVHHAYSKNAEVIVPCLADWETHWKNGHQIIEKPRLPAPNLPLQPTPEMVLNPSILR